MTSSEPHAIEKLRAFALDLPGAEKRLQVWIAESYRLIVPKKVQQA